MFEVLLRSCALSNSLSSFEASVCFEFEVRVYSLVYQLNSPEETAVSPHSLGDLPVPWLSSNLSVILAWALATEQHHELDDPDSLVLHRHPAVGDRLLTRFSSRSIRPGFDDHIGQVREVLPIRERCLFVATSSYSHTSLLFDLDRAGEPVDFSDADSLLGASLASLQLTLVGIPSGRRLR